MTSYTSLGCAFMFLAAVIDNFSRSEIIVAGLCIAAIVCFILANRQEYFLFKRVSHLETQLRVKFTKTEIPTENS